MAVGGGTEEKQGFKDWLFSKVMHNADAEYGFEPFHKEAMENRDNAKREAYAEEQNKKHAS